MATKQLRHLLDFAVGFDQFQQDARAVYEQLGAFLEKAVSARPLIIFSRPIVVFKGGGAVDMANACRVVFNRHAYEEIYHREDIDRILVDLCGHEFPEEGWKGHRLLKSKSSFIIFYCRVSEKQLFFGGFTPRGKVETLFMDRLVYLMKTAEQALIKVKCLEKFRDIVHLDDVTGLYNQRKLLADLDDAVIRYRNLKEEFSIFFLDIDHFKKVNDRFGHLVGTQLLTEMAQLLRKTLRESDLIYRYGGDEFVMIVPEVGHHSSIKIGERILKAVKRANFGISQKNIFDGLGIFKLSVSIGVAEFPRDARTRNEILEIADRMLFRAKKRGRGRVCYVQDVLN